MAAIQRFYRNHRGPINKAVMLITLFLGVFIFVNYLYGYIAPFFIGFLISLLADRPITFLRSKLKIGRGISALIFILVFVFGISFFGYWIVNTAYEQGVGYVSKIPQYSEDIARLFNSWRGKFDHVITLIPNEWISVSESAFSSLMSNLGGVISSGVKSGSAGIAYFVPNAIMMILLTIISAFFFIKDKDLIYKTILNHTPIVIKRNFEIVRTGLFRALFGYIKAQLIIMSVTSSIIILGLTILRHPFSVFLGILIGLVDALPIFGSGAVFWPWALLSVINCNIPYAVGLMAIYGVVFITRQVIEPKVLSSQIGIHPLLTLISIYVGLKIFGVLGFFIGPMVCVISKIILGLDFKDEVSEDKEPEEDL